MNAITDPTDVPYGSPPAITIHVLKENKRPVGFAPWPERDAAKDVSPSPTKPKKAKK